MWGASLKKWIDRNFELLSIAWAIAGICILLIAVCLREEFNEIGDFLAGWFAPLAFAWFVRTVYLQKEELADNRKILEMQAEELKLQREELEGAKAALQGQSETMQEQVLLTTFFNMLMSFQNIVASMENRGKTGKKVLRAYRVDLLSIVNNAESSVGLPQLARKFYDVRRSNLSHYVRLVVAILELASSSEDKEWYINIFLGYLSDDDLYVLFAVSALNEYHQLANYANECWLFDGLDFSVFKDYQAVRSHVKQLGINR